MSRLLCCRRRRDMGAGLTNPQEGEACEVAGALGSPPTMADVIRERKKKAGSAALGTLKRRIANVTRTKDCRPDRGNEHARYIRSIVSSWSVGEVFLLCSSLEESAALRDLTTQAELARPPAAALPVALHRQRARRWWCDVELIGPGWSTPVSAHKCVLAARSTYFRDLLHRHPSKCTTVSLDGVGASLTRSEVECCVRALYMQCAHYKWDRGGNFDNDLDIINTDNNGSCRSLCTCSYRIDEARMSRLAAALGFSHKSLTQDMKSLLDSAEWSDTWLTFSPSGGGSGGGGMPCHRAVLAATSSLFRSILYRRNSSINAGVCIESSVVPQRFMPAILHAAYTDQVDLNLVGRNSSTISTATISSSSSSWPASSRNLNRAAQLDDAFHLYEIGRFLEMPILVQGCEDAIVQALSAETLHKILHWSSHKHASHWVHRQAMRYFREEFGSVMASAQCGLLPCAALCAALESDYLQATEPQVLRAALKWAEASSAPGASPSPNVVWHASGGNRAARRRELGAARLRAALAPLLPLLRVQHLPRDLDLLSQLVRRCVVPADTVPAGPPALQDFIESAGGKPLRCLNTFLDELKALLEDQTVPEAELERLRRSRFNRRIPDALYMVAGPAPRSLASAPSGGLRAWLDARLGAKARARARELSGGGRHAHAAQHYEQIALRALREMALPDECAPLIIEDLQRENKPCSGVEWESPRLDDAERLSIDNLDADCCRSQASGRASSSQSLRTPGESSRSSTCRRNEGSRSIDGAAQRAARLSARVPDVALAPNANTHLLSHRDYFTLSHHKDYMCGGVLQLDLGDGATHTPRPGSRAGRGGRSSRPVPPAVHSSTSRNSSTLPTPGRYPLAMARRSPSPRRALPTPLLDYRLEGGYGSSTSNSRGPSPSSYA